MCGLAGILTTRAERRASLEPALARLRRPLTHRGPDDDGAWWDADAGIGLGFRRLSILDLSPAGHQPMASASGRYRIAFNGEIYNHRTLRDELAGLGHAFRGHSDTEVILAAVEAWGVRGTLPRLAGMFAIALWDGEARTLTLVRDRLGKKPLFVARAPGLVLFASELKALVADPDFPRRIDASQLPAFARYLYVPAPGSIYRDVLKLTPGHLLTIRDADAPLAASEPWWEAERVADAGAAARGTWRMAGDERVALSHLHELLLTATRERLESDVPLGALLSGGVDSALTVALMQQVAREPVRTFTIGFDDEAIDETAAAARIAAHLGTRHVDWRVGGAEALAVVPELPRIFDEPFADPSVIPTVLLCRLARRDVTVALCGDGGDEVFAGYTRYEQGRKLLGRIAATPAPLRTALGALLTTPSATTWDALAAVALAVVPRDRRPPLIGERVQKVGHLFALGDAIEGYRSLRAAWLDPRVLLDVASEAPDRLLAVLGAHPTLALAERMMLADQVTYLPDDLLAKIDRASMAVGLEVRAPLLDHRVLEFAWTLPHDLRVRQGTTKWVLRELLARHVPRPLWERPKRWFTMPVRGWLTGPLRDWAESLLTDGMLREVPVLRASAVRAEWARVQAGRAGNGHAMWGVLQLLAWWREWRPTL
ncbi:MAG: asparagine synthase (glutamine-hydrolyzing) [Gemmatimonadaceae bacterium]|nr:asparagine synthase (glutamine-hydrolyzing) [Gemmatimonadaceae bacterium]